MKNWKIGKGILVVGLMLYGPMDVVAQSVTYNHDAAKMNQITVGETGSGSLTPTLYYQTLHKSYSKSAAGKNKLSYRTLAGVNLYNQVDEAEALDSAMVARAKIEALNVADRSGGALDVAWAAEGGKITDKMGDFERNINRILQTGGNGDDQSYWKAHYQMFQCAIKPRRMPICPMPSARSNTCVSIRRWRGRTKNLSATSSGYPTHARHRNCLLQPTK